MQRPKRWVSAAAAVTAAVAASTVAASTVSAAAVTAAAPAGAPRADQIAFRELYRELIETNTSHSIGSCTLAAEKMAAHLRAAGFPESDLHAFAEPAHPKDGGLVAVLPGKE
ncbi:MAG TPA: hypothetical protein VNX69_11075, partial [Steroidobacteraceae bacterium]|nr:hypothetical protein [Steroidobacteraceae bacterium]